jgi:hypothetical protein
MTFGTETKTGRGGFLTAMTFFLVLAGSVDLLKAFTKPAPPGQKMMGMDAPATGIMFLGALHTGPSATILGVLLAAILFFYAIGIWRMKRYAMTLAWSYAAYVILNVTLFTVRTPPPRTRGSILFAVVYLIGAITLTVSTAISLTRRRSELS